MTFNHFGTEGVSISTVNMRFQALFSSLILKMCFSNDGWQGMVSMWTGNNFTRPLRLAAAAALAPVMDKVLKKTQKVFKLADEASAFLYLAIALWGICLTAVGLLILSRMGR